MKYVFKPWRPTPREAALLRMEIERRVIRMRLTPHGIVFCGCVKGADECAAEDAIMRRMAGA